MLNQEFQNWEREERRPGPLVGIGINYLDGFLLVFLIFFTIRFFSFLFFGLVFHLNKACERSVNDLERKRYPPCHFRQTNALLYIVLYLLSQRRGSSG